MATEVRKPQIVACFIGHVDSGKSTTVGHMSVLFGTTDKRKMEKLKSEAEKRNKGSFSYAYVCDTLGAERDRGITIKTNLIKLNMKDRTVNIMDCPGHKDFIKNMVTGAAQADVAIVIVPCARGEFESAISGGTLKEHVLIAGVFGVRKVVIAVNKVDTVPPAEQEARFNEVVAEMRAMVKSCHPEKNPIVVPISGMQGTNLSNSSEKFPWWKGFAVDPKVYPTNIFTLEDALLATPIPERPVTAPLRAHAGAVVKMAGLLPITLGQVVTGTLNVGDQIIAYPCLARGEVKSIEIHRQPIQTALPGENFGAIIKIAANCNEAAFHKGGNVMCNAAQEQIKTGVAYLSDMVNIAHKGFTTKYAPTMGVYTNAGPVQCVKFLSSQSMKNKEVKHENPEIVQKNFKFTVILKPLGTEKFVAEPYSVTPQLGRCCLRDGGKIVAIGQIKQVLNKEEYLKHGLTLESSAKGPKIPAANKKK